MIDKTACNGNLNGCVQRYSKWMRSSGAFDAGRALNIKRNWLIH